jgi:hypothetical protein
MGFIKKEKEIKKQDKETLLKAFRGKISII